LVCGTSHAHLKLEAAIAERKGTMRALTFSTGYAAAMGSIPALMGKSDFIIVDKLASCFIGGITDSCHKLANRNRACHLGFLQNGRLKAPHSEFVYP
jgi:7-keto-8-aminopelargonate synthetase-like enzyme